MPALGAPTIPASANSFNSNCSTQLSPGSPSSANTGNRFVEDTNLVLPRPPRPAAGQHDAHALRGEIGGFRWAFISSTYYCAHRHLYLDVFAFRPMTVPPGSVAAIVRDESSPLAKAA